MAVFYFGCNGKPGHYLFDQYGRGLDGHRADHLMLPRDSCLDGSPVFLPPEKVGIGALTYLPANDRTVLAWWGSPWDKRGRVNTAVIVTGKHTADQVWEQFVRFMPAIAEHLKMPTIVAGEHA